MRNKFLLLLALVAVLIVSGAQAADIVDMFGIPNSSGVAPLRVDTDGVIVVAPDAGLKVAYEVATTSDTITAEESGKTFIYKPASTTSTFILPDADVGMFFKFTAANGGATKKMVINPQDTDYIRGAVNSAALNTFATGDSITSPGNTGDSITFFCAEDLYWDVVDRTGTFVDSN